MEVADSTRGDVLSWIQRRWRCKSGGGGRKRCYGDQMRWCSVSGGRIRQRRKQGSYSRGWEVSHGRWYICITWGQKYRFAPIFWQHQIEIGHILKHRFWSKSLKIRYFGLPYFTSSVIDACIYIRASIEVFCRGYNYVGKSSSISPLPKTKTKKHMHCVHL